MVFLGHVVSKEGVKVNLQKFKEITEWPRLNNVTDIISFSGLAVYYRRSAKDYSKIAPPLTNLLKKASMFEYTEKCEWAFQELRQRLTTGSILTLLVEGKEYIIYSDASKNGLGCVLM